MFKSLKGFMNGFLIVCIIYLMLSLVFFPQNCINAGKIAVLLCSNTIIPSLFPFFICSGLFSAFGLASFCSKFLSPLMRPLFNLPGSGAMAFIIGIVSGYPTGATCATDLYCTGECSKVEAERMLGFCNNSGPLFIIGVVGCGFLSNVNLGYLLYASHILAAIITGLIFRFYNPTSKNNIAELPAPQHKQKNNTASIISSVVDNSISTIFKVCAFVLLFSVFSATLPTSRFTPFLHAFFEVTGGIGAISGTTLDFPLKIAIVSFFLSFSGVSIIFQVSSIITPRCLSLFPYILGKIIHGVLSFVMTYYLLTYMPITENVFAHQDIFLLRNFSPSSLFISSVVCAFLGCLLLVFLSQLFRLLKKLSH